jgi:hypothetical protein
LLKAYDIMVRGASRAKFVVVSVRGNPMAAEDIHSSFEKNRPLSFFNGVGVAACYLRVPR